MLDRDWSDNYIKTFRQCLYYLTDWLTNKTVDTNMYKVQAFADSIYPIYTTAQSDRDTYSSHIS